MKRLLFLTLSVFGSFIGYRDLSKLQILKKFLDYFQAHNGRTEEMNKSLPKILPELKQVLRWKCSFDDPFCMYKNVYRK